VALLGILALLAGTSFLVVGTLVPDCGEGVADTTCLETVPGSFDVEPGVNRRVLLAFRADDGRSSSRSVSKGDTEEMDRWVYGLLHDGSLVAAEQGERRAHLVRPTLDAHLAGAGGHRLAVGAALLALAWWLSRRGGPPRALPPVS
jgi:hypothetical protein